MTNGVVSDSIFCRTRVHTSILWLDVGDGESVGGDMGVVILGEGGVLLEEVNSWNGISIDLTHQLDTTPSLQTYWNSHSKDNSWYWMGRRRKKKFKDGGQD